MRPLPVLFVLCLWPIPALAGDVTSAYTKFDLKDCRQITPEDVEWSGSFICKGYDGLDVYFAEGDLRQMLAYGKEPQNHCATRQTFGPFNWAYPTIEWRLEGGRPFAAIQRWSVSDPEHSEKHKTWLAVTRIEAADSCRVAVVEGSMPDANQLARNAADDLARSFDCLKDEAKVISHDPANVEGLTSSSPCTAE